MATRQRTAEYHTRAVHAVFCTSAEHRRLSAPPVALTDPEIIARLDIATCIHGRWHDAAPIVAETDSTNPTIRSWPCSPCAGSDRFFKDLAQETAKATEDIIAWVQAIQSDTESAVAAIAKISLIIDQIHDYQNMIATAVEEQTVTTSEINRSTVEAAAGARRIAESISMVSRTAGSTAETVSTGRQVAASLAELSSELDQLISRFRY